ncbi:DUF4351 domain-containing protein [Egbenema bharatensis]|uniref:DUF4351 domain-containing protein n=1 Tax=Egbenema bharatensis TaxID=3463334 RepID=UPI003A85E4EE
MIQQILREEIVKESVIYQDILQQGLQQGLQREASFVLRLLKRQLGELDSAVEFRIRSLSVDQLEALGEASLDFTQPEELMTWLERNSE